MMTGILSGYKTYIVAALALVAVLAEGLSTGKWNAELAAIGLVAATLRSAISGRE
jgi:hypothetical protein